ncbi:MULTISPECIES: YhcN/YlaJ family sporulation lipoprotein [unclassified Bacillus (in: firmicutes)]|uniref:YhcN/YlaJ family sporulation lipoprotein n=1 Tax=unclassified Bacillus (in: firmicutes) TaxID=185979 RepID=UPI003D248EAE
MRKFGTISLLFLLLFGFLCGCHSPLDKQVKQESTQKRNKTDAKLTKVNIESIDQSAANEAKNKILAMDEILEVKAVNFNNELYVAVKPKHRERFQLKKLRKEIKQTLKKMYPNVKIYVSTDKKIFTLLDKLDTKIKNKELDKEEVKKQLKIVKKEMHSDT